MNTLSDSKKIKTETIKKFLFDKSALSVVTWMFILISVYSVVSGTLLLCPAQDVLLNILFQFFLMTVPGFAVTVTLFSEKHDPIFTAGLSYAFGYVIVIIEYLSAMAVGRQYSLPTALLVFALSCFLLWKKKDELMISHPDEEVSKGILLVFLAVLIVSFFCFSAVNGGANLTEIFGMRVDTQYWLNNASALAISFPANTPRLPGFRLNYHYFSSIQLAFQSNVTGMTIYSLGTVYYALPKSILMFGGIYAVLKSLRLHNKSIIFALIGIIFSTGIEVYNRLTIIAQNMQTPFGYDVGVGCCCWMLYFVIEQYHKKVFDYSLCVGAVLLMLTATGTKAPSALIFMTLAGIICFDWLLGKEYKKAFSYGISILAAFILVYFVFISGPTSATNSARSGGFSPYQLFTHSAMASNLYTTCVNHISPKFLALPTMVLFFLLSDPLPTFLGIVGLAHIARWKKNRTSLNVGFAVSILIGTCMGIFWSHEGNSNAYYSMTSRVIAILFGVCLFDQEIAKIKISLSRNFASFLAVILSFQVFLFSFVGYYDGCLKTMGRGIVKLVNVYTDNDVYADVNRIRYDSKNNHYYYFGFCLNHLSKDKVEALNWIRINSEKNAIIATDESVSENPSVSMLSYMYSPIFSERNVYLEGYKYSKDQKMLKAVSHRNHLLLRTYCNDKKALLQIKKEGVDYIVCDRRKYPLFTPTPKYATIVFRNGSISVYKIK